MVMSKWNLFTVRLYYRNEQNTVFGKSNARSENHRMQMQTVNPIVISYDIANIL